tara:strand:+ start:562 stop:1380 length:819 start_codon:yes stop_codon:yes gene_type:complete
MFGGFTERKNFGNQSFPTRTLGQFGNQATQIAANFLNATQISDTTIVSAINQLVADLFFYGLITKLKAVYPFVGSTSVTQKFNLLDPRDLNIAFRLSFVGGWSFSSNGALPNGTNAYCDSFFNTQNNYTSINSASFGIYSRTNSTGATRIYGNNAGGNLIHHNLNGGFIIGGAASVNYTANPSTSLLMASRTSSSLLTAYRGGVSLGTNTATITAFNNLNFFFGARNDSGTPLLFSNHELAFAFLGDGLNPTESGNLYTAVQAFQTTLARQI